ncbi:hypothetical protein CRENBAI_020281 [Crenichthys baileyi]|uniref:ITPR-interacting domain-containing protein n=1 Tax=Crenichthys baileyi TaxID=28760 RepID=A0AAV9RIL1_9TELE
MDRSSSTVRRRAWINSCRQWPTVEDPEGPLSNIAASASIADDDDVFSDAGFTGKIENWLLGCGSDVCLENSGQLSFESALQANTFSDDLSLGADALLVNFGETTNNCGHPSLIKQQSGISSSTPRQKLCPPSLNLGHSMASSCLSSSTWKTVSSMSEVLQMCSEDAEETLYELGFGCEESQVTVRIPPRFFTFPSQAQGINFRLFLDAQIRRIREEDPSLSLASRFRQVQVLTAMANAFYSLYSHVSRTPLQKLATPEFSFSSPVERIERFRTSIRSEPRSPVERLKDTVNKMCLYTGSPRGSDSTSPQPSPRKRSSLPEVVDIMLKSKTGSAKKLELGEHDRKALQVDGSRSPPVLKPSGSYGHCCITVTGWEEEDVSLSSMNSADSCHAPPASSTRTPAELFNEEEGQYLNPLTHPGPGKFSSNRQQVNSFELEEVHSAGEDDFGQPEATRTVTLSLCKKHSYKGEVVRGDSMQSDSSGYADEEVSPSPDRHSR